MGEGGWGEEEEEAYMGIHEHLQALIKPEIGARPCERATSKG